ncbi:MAG: hypothetical protein EBY16_04410 [Gammaproteobacteria bacterium]|nr:hypothetical protein [Gammaproteobacteria bacterium]
MPGLNHDRNPTLAALYGLAGAANRIAQAYTVASCAAKEELSAAESVKTLLVEARGAGAMLGVVESEAVRLARLGLRAEARDAALRSVLLASLRARKAQSVYLQVEKLYREIADKAIALAESDGLSVISSPLSLI